MYKSLFTNVIQVSQKKEQVQYFLENITNLLKWNHDILLVEEYPQSMKVNRIKQAANNQEIIHIKKEGDKIIYAVQGDQLNYEIWFELEQRDEFLEISETVLLSEENDTFLISFLKPIMKQAFFNKLEMLSLVLAR